MKIYQNYKVTKKCKVCSGDGWVFKNKPLKLTMIDCPKCSVHKS